MNNYKNQSETSVLVAVPVYNEEASLPTVIKHLKTAITAERLLFIDDGSRDGSRRILDEAGVHFISHPVNMGYHEALRTAMIYTLANGFEAVVFFDSDGQHQTQDLLNLLHSAQETPAELYIGSRYLNQRKTVRNARNLGTDFFSRTASVMSGTRITDATSGMKYLHRRIIPTVLGLQTEDLHAEMIVGVARSGCRIREIPITVEPRTEGTSMYHLMKGLLYPLKTGVCMLVNSCHTPSMSKLRD